MFYTPRATAGMFSAPHYLAAQAGRDVLREGGNAIEAMVAAAAAIAVVYPHMNGIGGDGFWLIREPGEEPVGIDAGGPAAANASVDFYRGQGLDAVPARGPGATLTVAGTVAGWQTALVRARQWGGRLPLSRLLEPAIHYARDAFPVSSSQARHTDEKTAELRAWSEAAHVFLANGNAMPEGWMWRQPRLADTLERLAMAGLDDFYRGDIGDAIAADLEAAGSPLSRDDLAGFSAREVAPLSVEVSVGRVYNLPPPTQGLVSLFILGVFDRLGIVEPEGFDYIHGLVEATKAAFAVRDRHVTDPAFMTVDPSALIDPARLEAAARGVSRTQANEWGGAAMPGDTVWMGCIDGQGRAVSFIQSLYWEFGSGVVLPSTGVLWQNRGHSFSMDAAALQVLRPGRRPFHTLNPALATLSDGTVLAYGAMGGEGQPQTQAAVFSRYAMFRQPLQASVAAPRWLLGRTWGQSSASLKIETRFFSTVLTALELAGHDLQRVGAFDEMMGHAGAVACRPDGVMEGATDPRSDGLATGL